MSKNSRLIRGSPGNETIHFRYNDKRECIFVMDILYFESDRVYSLIFF
jgi:hypothetical protein